MRSPGDDAHPPGDDAHPPGRSSCCHRWVPGRRVLEPLRGRAGGAGRWMPKGAEIRGGTVPGIALLFKASSGTKGIRGAAWGEAELAVRGGVSTFPAAVRDATGLVWPGVFC